MTAETCSQLSRRVYDAALHQWVFRECGRPIKRDGLCGIHAAAQKKRARNETRRREVYEAREARWAVERELERRIRELGGRWPITREELVELLEADSRVASRLLRVAALLVSLTAITAGVGVAAVVVWFRQPEDRWDQ